MDRIDQMLTTSRQDTALNPAVAAALINAKRVMNKDYSKTDLSYVYRIAMSTSHLHLIPIHLFIIVQPFIPA
jgi:hypothetical protein